MVASAVTAKLLSALRPLAVVKLCWGDTCETHSVIDGTMRGACVGGDHEAASAVLYNLKLAAIGRFYIIPLD